MKIPFIATSRESRKDKQIKFVIAFLILLLAGAMALVAYRQISINHTRKAQQAFSDCLVEFGKASSSDTAKWSDVVRAFDEASERFGKTVYAPMFLAYKAQALLLDGQKDKAREVLAQAVAEFEKKSIQNVFMQDLYKTTLALMKIDSDDQAVKAVGQQELEALASAKSGDHERALYYLGLYALHAGNEAKAREYWNQLISGTSVWSVEAKQRLNLRGSLN